MFGMESNPVGPGAWREHVDREQAQLKASSVSCVSDVLKIADRNDAPAFASVQVVAVDLEARNRTWTLCELGADCRPEDDRPLTDRIVDREDLRTTGNDNRQPAELLT